MTSASLKIRLPDDNRPVFVWVCVDGQWLLKQVQTVQENKESITIEVKDA